MPASRVICPLIGLITIVTLLQTPRISTHEPQSTRQLFYLMDADGDGTLDWEELRSSKERSTAFVP